MLSALRFLAHLLFQGKLAHALQVEQGKHGPHFLPDAFVGVRSEDSRLEVAFEDMEAGFHAPTRVVQAGEVPAVVPSAVE